VAIQYEVLTMLPHQVQSLRPPVRHHDPRQRLSLHHHRPRRQVRVVSDPYPSGGGAGPRAPPARRRLWSRRMRWFAQRLLFYVVALWVALTINFLLPRLMPGDPIAGLLAHLNPSQLAANPGLIQTYQAMLGGGHHSIWQDYVTYLHRVAHFDFGLSTSNWPTPVSEVVGRTLPYSIFLVGVAFLLAFFLGTAVGMVAAWRRGRVVDTVAVPGFMVLGAFPAFFTALIGLWLFGLELHWFPIQHAYDTGLTPGFNWAFLSSTFRHSQLPILVIVAAYTG